MPDFIVLGTDTDAGKTTFALLWLSAFPGQYAYWKPVESGQSDSQCVQRLVPETAIFAPAVAVAAPLAPPLAAKLENTHIPSAAALAAARPRTSPPLSLLVETFGSPFSPLNDTELQIELLRELGLPMVLVGSSRLGAIGRALQCLRSLESEGLRPSVLVLLGPVDSYAVDELRKHAPDTPCEVLLPPTAWTAEGIAECTTTQRECLRSIACALRPIPTWSCEELIRRDQTVVWHPYTSLADPDAPLPCVGAQDEFLGLADGRRLIDGISSWWTILHGHRHPLLMEALHTAARSFDHVLFAGVTHAPGVQLAELLLQSMPWRGGRVFYSDNGSTAVEVALKMAYQFWRQRGEGEAKRDLFVGFAGGYHGDTFGSMAVGRDPVFFGLFEPLLFRAEIVPLSPDHLADSLAKNRGRVAAVIVEPLVQGAGGMRMHSPEVLHALSGIARDHDVLFIVDEVMTGGGRTGTLWAHQAAGITPDIVCAAKTLAGGVLSLAATVASPRIVEAFDTQDRARTFFHGHSFTAHPLACAVAVANWKLLTQSFPSAPRRFEDFWNQALAPLRGQPGVRDVRIRGTIAAVELDVPGGYLADIGRRLRHYCLERGVSLRPLGNVLYAMPPYCTSQESLESIATTIKDAVTSLATR